MKKYLYCLFTIFFLILFIFNLSNGCLFAEEKKVEKETVYIKAGHVKYIGEVIEFSAGVEIKKDDNIMKAPSGNYDKENKKIFLENGVNARYNKGNIEAQILTGWLEENKYIFENNVILKHNLTNDKTFNLETLYLEMLADTNSFTAEEEVLIKHEGKIIKAKTADYEDKTEILKLSGDVYVKENGDWIKSNKAEFNLGGEDEEFTADGNVELEISF